MSLVGKMGRFIKACGKMASKTEKELLLIKKGICKLVNG